MLVVRYICLACKAPVIRFDEQVPRVCKKCGSGSAWMKEERKEVIR